MQIERYSRHFLYSKTKIRTLSKLEKVRIMSIGGGEENRTPVRRLKKMGFSERILLFYIPYVIRQKAG